MRWHNNIFLPRQMTSVEKKLLFFDHFPSSILNIYNGVKTAEERSWPKKFFLRRVPGGVQIEEDLGGVLNFIPFHKYELYVTELIAKALLAFDPANLKILRDGRVELVGAARYAEPLVKYTLARKEVPVPTNFGDAKYTLCSYDGEFALPPNIGERFLKILCARHEIDHDVAFGLAGTYDLLPVLVLVNIADWVAGNSELGDVPANVARQWKDIAAIHQTAQVLRAQIVGA